MDIPDDLKKEIRAVLLSKVGGTSEKDFTKDYKNLCRKRFEYSKYGFKNAGQLLLAIPDIVKSEFDKKSDVYKFYGHVDKENYIPLIARKAQFKGKGDKNNNNNNNNSKSQLSAMPYKDSPGGPHPNKRRYYAICFKKGCCNLNENEIREKFSVYGEIVELNQSPRWWFVHYGSKEPAVKAVAAWFNSVKV